MAYRDYIHCEDCDCKLVYDGDDKIREGLERTYGNVDDSRWTVKLACPECLMKLRARVAELEKERDALAAKLAVFASHAIRGGKEGE